MLYTPPSGTSAHLRGSVAYTPPNGAAANITSELPIEVVHTIAPSGGDYTSLAAWEAAQQRDLVAANEIAVAECESMTDAPVTLAGWTTSADAYIHIRAAAGHGVAGPYWESTRYRISGSGDVVMINAQVNHARFTGLYLEHTTARWNNAAGIAVAPSADGAHYEIDRCYFRNADLGGAQINGTFGFAFGNLEFAKTVIVRNSISFGAAVGFRLSWSPTERPQTLVLHNVLSSGGETGQGGHGYRFGTQPNCTERVVNCIGLDHSSEDFYDEGLAGTLVHSHNASSDVTAFGSNTVTNFSPTRFINAAAGDFRIRYDDTVLGGAGTSLAAAPIGAFSTDISGFARTGAWDIGPCQAPTLVVHDVAAAGGDYTSLAAWESAQQRNLVAANEVAMAECGAFLDTAVVEIDGWTTSEIAYPFIRAAAGAEARLPYSDTAYRLHLTNPGGQGCLSTTEDFTRIERIQIQHTLTADSGRSAIAARYQTGAGKLWVDRCVIRGVISGTTNASAVRVVSGITVPYVSNTVALNYSTTTGGYAFEPGGAPPSSWFYNCSAINCIRGFQLWSSTRVKNCLFDARSLASPVGFSGSSHADNTNNASSDATAPGSNARQSQTFYYVDEIGGDFRLASTDAGAKSFGLDLSGDATIPVTVDVNGNARSGAWDIGAANFATGYSMIVGDRSICPSTWDTGAASGNINASIAPPTNAPQTYLPTLPAGYKLTELWAYLNVAAGRDTTIPIGVIDINTGTASTKPRLHVTNVPLRAADGTGWRWVGVTGLAVSFDAHAGKRIAAAMGRPADGALVQFRYRAVTPTGGWYISSRGGDLTLPDPFPSGGSAEQVSLYAVFEPITSSDVLVQPSVASDVDGLMYGSLTSTLVGRKRITALIDGSPITDVASVLVTEVGSSLVAIADEALDLDEIHLALRGLRRVADESLQGTHAGLALRALLRLTEEAVSLSESDAYARALLRLIAANVNGSETTLTTRTLRRLAAEGITSEEEVARTLALLRIFNELFNHSEAVQPGRFILRFVTNATDVSDARLLVRELARIQAESKQLGEPAPAGQRGRRQLQSATVELTEARNTVLETVLQALIEVISESVEVSEGALRLRALARVLAESLESTDEQVRLRSLLRLLAEAVEADEALVSARSMLRRTAEVTELADTGLSVRTLLRLHAESISLSDASLRLRALARQVQQALQPSEASARLRTLRRVLEETEQASEQHRRLQDRIRRLNEATSLTSLLIPVVGRIRSVGETVELSEAVNYFLEEILFGVDLVRVVNASVELDELQLHLRTLLRRTGEGVNTEDSEQALRTLLRLRSAALQVAEEIDAARTMRRRTSEGLEVDQALLQIRSLARTIAEASTLAEAYPYLRSLLRVRSEDLSIAYTRSAARALARLQAEGGTVAEARVGRRGLFRAVSESMNLVEALRTFITTAGLDLLQVILEELEATDSTGSTRSLLRKVAEVEQQLEARQPLRTLLRRIGEALDLSDVAAGARALRRSLADSMGVTETRTKAKALLKRLAEGLTSTEAGAHAVEIIKQLGAVLGVTEAGQRYRSLMRRPAENVGVSTGSKPLRTLLRLQTEALELSLHIRRVFEQSLLYVVAEGLELASSLSQLMPYALIGGRIVVSSVLSGTLAIRDRIRGFLRISRGA